ncbi:MAG: hypothetical protein C5B51_10050 [Terriglobia bacterium]|nr:MAG: hypothetical protein C5B51_10050 [Terriglobia bacterium]
MSKTASAEALRDHLAYTTWASRRLVDAAAQLSQEELTRDFQTADHSILGTLVHVFAADRIWLARVFGNPVTAFITDADYSMQVLQTEWPALLDRWKDWAQGLTDESVGSMVSYDRLGTTYHHPIWHVVLHVVNHGTHHRGQVSGFLRMMGHTPPPLDLTAYYREQG